MIAFSSDVPVGDGVLLDCLTVQSVSNIKGGGAVTMTPVSLIYGF